MNEIGPAGVPRGALRNGSAELRRTRDWSGYTFDRRISPMDVDGLFVLESRGHFLFLEVKAPGEPFPKGQRDCLEALSRLPNVGVLRVVGTPAEPVACQWCRRGVWGNELRADRDFLQGIFAGWFAKQK